MSEFDNLPERAGSGSYKWDEYPGMIPLWVADMDFRTAPCVIDALLRRVDHGVFGYTLVRDGYMTRSPVGLPLATVTGSHVPM